MNEPETNQIRAVRHQLEVWAIHRATNPQIKRAVERVLLGLRAVETKRPHPAIVRSLAADVAELARVVH